MTIAVANTSNTNNTAYLINRVNELAHALSNKVITVDSNTTSGNAVVNGVFQANTIKLDTLLANGTVLSITSNVNLTHTLSVGNSTVNTVINSTSLLTGSISVNGVVTISTSGLMVGSNTFLTTSGLSVGNSTINVAINSTSISISGRSLPDTGPVNTNITSSASIVDTFDIDTYRASEYVMSIVNNVSNGYQVSKMLVIGDGSDASITEFGVLSTNGQLGVFSANANSTTVKVYFTLASGITNVQIKGVRTPVPT